MKLHAPEIAREARPGQFCNVRVSGLTAPLLRRPFGICECDGEHISFLISVLGEGTKLLVHKEKGETVDVLGPLGNGFNTEGDFDTAVLVAGGIGAAPFPFLISRLPADKKILSFTGGRSEEHVITYGMENLFIATDDGSNGIKGSVIDLLKKNIRLLESGKIKLFGCGPTPMLRALKEFAIEHDFQCEVSTETSMACGFGICQGCPIEALDKEGYYLVCKDGPVFDVRRVKI